MGSSGSDVLTEVASKEWIPRNRAQLSFFAEGSKRPL